MTVGILSAWTITVITRGALPGSRENAFIVAQEFHVGDQKDYSIFRPRRKTSSLASSQIDWLLGPFLFDPLLLFLFLRSGLSSAKSPEAWLEFFIKSSPFPIMAGSHRVYRDEIRFSPLVHAVDEPFAPTGVYLLSILPSLTISCPLCMRSNWMLIARTVGSPSLRSVQIRNEILSPLGRHVHRCTVLFCYLSAITHISHNVRERLRARMRTAETTKRI